MIRCKYCGAVILECTNPSYAEKHYGEWYAKRGIVLQGVCPKCSFLTHYVHGLDNLLDLTEEERRIVLDYLQEIRKVLSEHSLLGHIELYSEHFGYDEPPNKLVIEVYLNTSDVEVMMDVWAYLSSFFPESLKDGFYLFCTREVS